MRRARDVLLFAIVRLCVFRAIDYTQCNLRYRVIVDWPTNGGNSCCCSVFPRDIYSSEHFSTTIRRIESRFGSAADFNCEGDFLLSLSDNFL